jgi:hypothetical protein
MKKEGFEPIIDKNTEILVLGTMPGDRSLQMGEYYANSKINSGGLFLKFSTTDVVNTVTITRRNYC